MPVGFTACAWRINEHRWLWVPAQGRDDNPRWRSRGERSFGNFRFTQALAAITTTLFSGCCVQK